MSPLAAQLVSRAALLREVVRDELRWYLDRLRDGRSDHGRMPAVTAYRAAPNSAIVVGTLIAGSDANGS